MDGEREAEMKFFNWMCLFVFGLMIAGCARMAADRVERQPLIVLLTDFGERDHYVGALKGAIYSANADARIENITHQVEKYDIWGGAYTLAEAAREYPGGTIFVAVVDPGVGSERKGITVLTENKKIFVGPDNGILSIAGNDAGVVEIREITNGALMHPGEISSTFHARDIFGPVAGHLATGVPFESVGPPLSGMEELSAPKAVLKEEAVRGAILHVDNYGNIITNIPIRFVEALGVQPGFCAILTIGEDCFSARFVRTYSDVAEGDFLFLNNRGSVEIAINQGDLGSRARAERGMEVILAPLHTEESLPLPMGCN
ncbi:MAG: hypothetical protein C4520_02560 [Candidatus Abyssobacteria bacterium SURF_5]|uniref:SAM-dependent chlorinase/fluorinase n=1 Tax=Abyssobacteria bacterium (strain SURF_5) TaxID=2093360 RepID=A0A3A4NY40_ABYX5|nr:MAG: hypothetical protein C4520_02560 [Candidatus Abyssubacteria bacterium SURF_5]